VYVVVMKSNGEC